MKAYFDSSYVHVSSCVYYDEGWNQQKSVTDLKLRTWFPLSSSNEDKTDMQYMSSHTLLYFFTT